MSINFCQVWVTCADGAEASKISGALLEKRLIACAKQIATKSQYRWQGKVEKAEEILLVMVSHEDLFDEIATIVDKLHSYDTPDLQAIPVSKVSSKTESWLNKELKGLN